MSPSYPIDDIRIYIQNTLSTWKVPGAGIAILKGDDVLLCEGFGLRNLADKLPVTPDTLFPIASCTKAFTALGVGLLVESGKLEWDKPVKEYLPDFKLYDPFASERMTVRDLLTHRSGLPRHDILWYASNFNRREIFSRLRYLEPNRDLRYTFQYQNIMFMVAGLLIEELTGSSWEDFTQKMIFDHLGMKNSNLSTAQTQQSPDFASPYIERKEEIRLMPFFEGDGEKDAVGPAGSIISSANDMAKWLRLHLNGGRLVGQQIISEANLIEMHSPQMVLAEFDTFPRVGLKLGNYGMGWMIHCLNGHILVHHGGHIDGFSALVSLMPEEGLGMVVLSNLNYNFSPETITLSVYERLLGEKLTDWVGRYKEIYTEEKAAAEKGKEKAASDRQTGTQPSHPLEAYLGEYEHPAYGTVSIQKQGEQMQLVLNQRRTFPLEHYHYDYFEAYIEEFDEKSLVSFVTDLKGNISQLSMQLEPKVKDIVFTRLPDKALTDPAFLAQFTGVYELGGKALTIALKGATLTAILPGQPEYTLQPYRGTEFHLKGLTGFSIEFKKDEPGKVVEAMVAQPGAVFSARKRIEKD